MKNIVILISGGGSNMAAMVRAAQQQDWPGRYGIRIAAVVSNKADAKGLALAREQGIATQVLDHKASPRARPLTLPWRKSSTPISRHWWCWPASCGF